MQSETKSKDKTLSYMRTLVSCMQQHLATRITPNVRNGKNHSRPSSKLINHRPSSKVVLMASKRVCKIPQPLFPKTTPRPNKRASRTLNIKKISSLATLMTSRVLQIHSSLLSHQPSHKLPRFNNLSKNSQSIRLVKERTSLKLK